MLEMFKNFESAVGGTANLSPLVLVGPGLAAVLVGLFVWLGGLGLRRPMFAVAGAATGAVFGYFIVGRNAIAATVLAGLIAAAAMIFQRVFFAVLAALLVAAFGFVVLSAPHIENPQPKAVTNQDKVSSQHAGIGIGESMERLKASLFDVAEKIRQACSRMPARNWAIIVAMAVICTVAGFWLRRLTPALCCAVIGTMLVFAGMIMLLLYKGTEPIRHIGAEPSFYASVFVAMVFLGTVEQLVLCRYAGRRLGRKKEAGNSKEKNKVAKKNGNWRTL